MAQQKSALYCEVTEEKKLNAYEEYNACRAKIDNIGDDALTKRAEAHFEVMRLFWKNEIEYNPHIIELKKANEKNQAKIEDLDNKVTRLLSWPEIKPEERAKIIADLQKNEKGKIRSLVLNTIFSFFTDNNLCSSNPETGSVHTVGDGNCLFHATYGIYIPGVGFIDPLASMRRQMFYKKMIELEFDQKEFINFDKETKGLLETGNSNDYFINQAFVSFIEEPGKTIIALENNKKPDGKVPTGYDKADYIHQAGFHYQAHKPEIAKRLSELREKAKANTKASKTQASFKTQASVEKEKKQPSIPPSKPHYESHKPEIAEKLSKLREKAEANTKASKTQASFKTQASVEKEKKQPSKIPPSKNHNESLNFAAPTQKTEKPKALEPLKKTPVVRKFSLAHTPPVAATHVDDDEKKADYSNTNHHTNGAEKDQIKKSLTEELQKNRTILKDQQEKIVNLRKEKNDSEKKVSELKKDGWAKKPDNSRQQKKFGSVEQISAFTFVNVALAVSAAVFLSVFSLLILVALPIAAFARKNYYENKCEEYDKFEKKVGDLDTEISTKEQEKRETEAEIYTTTKKLEENQKDETSMAQSSSAKAEHRR
jgi:hypothetical protein